MNWSVTLKMKISKIEFENFRNFKNHGEIKCSTDGKVTIIYGKNGDGKTTLHQLLQWIFYGQVKFNKTTTNNLYNLKYEREQEYGNTFDVLGRIDFEHDNTEYSLTRKITYRKGLNDSERINEDFSLLKKDDDYNWLRIDRPNEAIEKLLPSGLADYFFFDGESMIADLRVKGKDSASKLRTALYSMFDLDIIESAINHIGRTDLKTTALGNLYLSKSTVASDSAISAAKRNLENAQNMLSEINNDLEDKNREKDQKKELVNSISEKIGSTKSKIEFENDRKNQKDLQCLCLQNSDSYKAQFGEEIITMFPKLFIHKAVNDAKNKINLEISKNKLPLGVNKKLIHYLLNESTTTCICGNSLCEQEKKHIQEWLELLPPKSYTEYYNDFSKTAEIWGNNYNLQKIESYIKKVLDNDEQARKCDIYISQIDEEEKKSADVEDLIITRQQAEADIRELDNAIQNRNVEQKKCELYIRKCSKIFDELTKNTEEGLKVSNKIEILETVCNYFKNKLAESSINYSEQLQNNIQELINRMLTSKRTVTVSPEFSVCVTDSYGDESKSEGQFAVISFAYIGGILKMLQEQSELAQKEYPLVLDGPFSKLDPDQRQNVVDTIPEFAPQVILFSKDDLHEVFSEEHIGRVWTIVSNEEKNIARVEEGYLWK